MKGSKGTAGGIQKRIIRLILIEVAVILAAIAGIIWYYSSTRDSLEDRADARKQESISEVSTAMMEVMISEILQGSNFQTMTIVDTLFEDVRNQVTYLAERAEELFVHPDQAVSMSVVEKEYGEENPERNTQLFYAPGTDPSDPDVAGKARLLTSLTGSMGSLCAAFGTADLYIATPEGIILSVNAEGEEGRQRYDQQEYDPRERIWYREAAEAGKLIFTEGETDARTGVFCVECAAPVYGPDGNLWAVAGADLFLNEIQEVMGNSVAEGEYHLLVSREGRAVLSTQEEAFPMKAEDRGKDLRQASTGLLAQVVKNTLQEGETYLQRGELADGEYYIIGTDIDVTGWALISAYSQASTEWPTELLLEIFDDIEKESNEEYHQDMRRFQIAAAALLLLVALAAVLDAHRIGKRVTNPLQGMTRRITEIGRDSGEFVMEDAYRTGDEVETLAMSFADLSRQNIMHMEEIRKATAEKERISTELKLAAEIQNAMLPHRIPPFPERTEFDLLGEMFPARVVGGDFYDYFLIDEDHLGLVIADVSGKGIPAALFMMVSKVILQNSAMLGRSAAEILRSTNEAISANNEIQMFVTVWLGILEVSTGRLTCANAGHEYPVLRHPGGRFELYKDPHGLVIGAMEGVKYREYELQLEPGSTLFVYTDGVPEATNAENELFGTQRMLDALNEEPDAQPSELMKRIRTSVDKFVQEAEQFDDLTMVCLKYRGRE